VTFLLLAASDGRNASFTSRETKARFLEPWNQTYTPVANIYTHCLRAKFFFVSTTIRLVVTEDHRWSHIGEAYKW